MAELMSGELVPIKDNCSTIDNNCRCVVDPRDRLFVCKLERDDLEDRHLRLLEENNCLKKLANAQADKIKRLATKLMRSGVNSRFCIAAVDVSEESERVCALEAENAKLKAQVNLLRGQMSNQKVFGRSPSRGRKNLHCSASGPITCRSEASRYNKAPTFNPRREDYDSSYRIQELEREKEEMSCRIMELESELSSRTSTDKREKVAENVEMIRVRRSMKQREDEFAEALSTNETLKDEVGRLRNLLEEACRGNKQICEELQAEKDRKAELEAAAEKASESAVDLREKEDAIAGLKSENAILADHNRKLLEISSKFARTEQECAELRRKLADKASEVTSFGDALSKEKANTLALQAANDQLLAKISDLQKSIDVMSIRLMTESTGKPSSTKRKSTKKSQSSEESSRVCKKCSCSIDGKSTRSVQTQANSTTNSTAQTETKAPADDDLLYDNKNKAGNNKTVHLAQNGSSLSRAEMLKLLEQVQISAPLDTQNTVRDATTTSTRSNLEALLFGDAGL